MNTSVSARLSARVAAFFLVLMALSTVSTQAAVKIQQVKSDSGVTAWLVEDYTVPIIAVRFAFTGGSTQDPVGKEGLSNLMTGLFDEGAGDLDSDTFQIRLDDAGAEMRFSASRDALYGSMRMLADQKDEAFELLRLAVNKPRFDQAPVDRIRSQIMAGIAAQERDPNTAAQIAWSEALYGDHPYSRRDDGTPVTLAAISRDDLKKLHAGLFARKNLTVGVVGAIDTAALKVALDKVFGELPEEPTLQTVAKATPKLGQMIAVPYDLPQTSLRLAYPGVERDDPDFFAAYLMNHILGGGTFSSRLFDEVREKRGLAYDVGSALVNNDHSNALVIGTATRSDRAVETLDIIKKEVKRMADEGPTQAELDAAKKYVAGAYAINNLDSSGSIANTLVELQRDQLGVDYIERRESYIEAVTLETTKAAAKRLLETEPAVMVVGPALTGQGQ